MWDERKARARAFVTQTLKPRHHWTEQPYAYDYQEDTMSYLGWFDDNAKKAPADKIAEAIAAYQARFQAAPNIVLVNAADAVELEHICVRVESYIRRNNFWIGWEA